MAPAQAQLQTMADAGDNRGRLGIEQARKRFPELVRRAAAGERIVICRHQEPLAALVSLQASANTAEDPEPASTLLSLQGSGRQCWDPAGSSTPTRPSRPPAAALVQPVRRHQAFDPRLLTEGSRIGFDGSALVAFLCDAQGTGAYIGPLMEGISQGYWRGLVSSLSLLRVLEGPLACGDERLSQRYSQAFNGRQWQVVAPDLAITTAAARLRCQEPALSDSSAVELATAIHGGAAVLVTDDPHLAQTGQHPVLSAQRL